MKYLKQSRGPGSSWVFRMVTPDELVGAQCPWTGKPFGKSIIKGLGNVPQQAVWKRLLTDGYLLGY
ncbi:hypothetical protein ACFQ2S_09960 [Tropicimonas aquimaris]|uniref:Uncharacterized protein n=1 Tax=Tropicimonas aquimaris TaxID=914152 RepID=A0ABW3IPE6_9RHOB